jgi:hypothetical protein
VVDDVISFDNTHSLTLVRVRQGEAPGDEVHDDVVVVVVMMMMMMTDHGVMIIRVTR